MPATLLSKSISIKLLHRLYDRANHRMDRFLSTTLVCGCLALIGCRDDSATVRQIQALDRSRMQLEAKQDDLGETFALLENLVELNPEQAKRQIIFHLNRWYQGKKFDSVPVSELIKTVSDVLNTQQASERTGHENYVSGDVEHLRGAYLFNRVVRWIDHPRCDDPLLTDWLGQLEKSLDDDDARMLRTATRLFDWTVRNVAYEPIQLDKAVNPLTGQPLQSPKMSDGLVFRGAG